MCNQPNDPHTHSVFLSLWRKVETLSPGGAMGFPLWCPTGSEEYLGTSGPHRRSLYCLNASETGSTE